jgi:hypothetical protein
VLTHTSQHYLGGPSPRHALRSVPALFLLVISGLILVSFRAGGTDYFPSEQAFNQFAVFDDVGNDDDDEAYDVISLAMDRRVDLGLRSDRQYVESLYRKSAEEFNASEDLWGVRLTDDELSEMEVRESVQANILAIREDAAALLGKRFSHVLFDHQRGGVIVVAIEEPDPDLLGVLRSRYPEASSRLVVDVVPVNARELHGLVDRMTRDFDRLLKDGVDVVFVYTNLYELKVVVGVSSSVVQAQQDLVDRYASPHIRVLSVDPDETGEDSCSSRSSCVPFRAGVQVQNVSRQLETSTGNFIAYCCDPRKWYWVASGHTGAVGETYRHNASYSAGSVERSAYKNNSTADALIVRISSTRKSRFVYNGDGDASRKITSRQGAFDDYVGQSVSMSGVASKDRQFGTIWALDYTTSSPKLIKQRLATYSRMKGDSGAPVYWSNMAMGIHAGRSPCSHSSGYCARYSQIRNVEVELLVLINTQFD